MGNFNSNEGEIIDNRYLLNNAIFPNTNITDLSQEEQNSSTIKIFTLNVANFQYVPEWSRRSEEIAALISKIKPDYMGLQEICVLPIERKNALADILKGLDFVWYTVWKLGSARKVLDAVTSSQEGIAAVSRLKIISKSIYNLPKLSGSKDKDNQRLLIIIRTIKKNKTIDFATTHLSLDNDDAKNQLTFIRTTLNEIYIAQDPNNYCQILVGDFNLVNDTDFDSLLSKADKMPDFQDAALIIQQDLPTFPSVKPDTRLDRLFFRGLSFTPKEITVQPSFDSESKMTSDHLFVTAAFDIDTTVPLFGLTSGQKLEKGMLLSSDNRFYNIFIDNDWNIVLYKSLVWSNPDNIVWKLLEPAVLQSFKSPCTLILQEDGNVVYVDSTNRVLWATDTWSKGYGPWALELSKYGQLSYTDSDSNLVWSK